MSENTLNPMETAPFYIGETVIAVDAMNGSQIKNGVVYRVYSCHRSLCKENYYWYVGVQRSDYKSHEWVRPSIFASVAEGKLMTFEKINEENPIYSN